MLPIRTSGIRTRKKMNHLSSPKQFYYIYSVETSSNDNHHHHHHQKGKTNPPISYPKDYNSPRPTTFVIKQLIGDGATLVYDSLTQNNTSSLLQHHFYPNHHFQKQRKEHVQYQQTNLTNPNTSSKQKTPRTTNNRNPRVS
jgi:hypothetical protein